METKKRYGLIAVILVILFALLVASNLNTLGAFVRSGPGDQTSEEVVPVPAEKNDLARKKCECEFGCCSSDSDCNDDDMWCLGGCCTWGEIPSAR